MRIGIDFRLGYYSTRGMGNYIRNLVLSIADIDKKNVYILYINQEKSIQSFNISSNFLLRKLKANYFVFEQFFLPYRAKKDKLDILWCPYNTFPFFLSKNIKLIVTIHDLIFYDKISGAMSFYQKIGKIYRKKNLLFGYKKINQVFTVSKYSSHLIMCKFAMSSIITYNNIEVNYPILVDGKQIFEKYHVTPNSYFYTISGDAPSKNLKSVLYTFKNNTNLIIVVTGVKNKSHFKEYLNYDNIIFTDVITENDKKLLLKNCKCFLFFSKEEGFGIPILEAMMYQKKIIASNTSVIPEILGKGGLLIDPVKENIQNTILSFANIEFDVFIKNQITQLNNFTSWYNTAKIILQTFDEMYSRTT
jgi:glycosyltransferase involved in cell wall biosynthesis